ncbi:hypothetical protein [Streptomyces sp. NPDC088557]|uniref:hypothetical protein n=1 Tax=Streptomyces sp. NPDC088557 TaxID=3365867 RepID=UPI0037FEF36D
MIRAGRANKVRTLTDLARQHGTGLRRYQTLKPYTAPGFPAPISSPGSRVLLFDADQVDAHTAGTPVPDLPGTDNDADLLDRREAAEFAGISLATWDDYRKRPDLADHLAVIAGVEHWPRSAITALRQAQADRPATGGRPKRTGDQVPRDQVLTVTAPLLDDDPTITAARVTEELGVHRDTAQRALTQLRAQRIADHLTTHPDHTPEQAAQHLGYPAGQVRTATSHALLELRARAATPYLDTVLQALRQAGLVTTDQHPAPEHDGQTVRAAVPLAPHAPAPALVWDETTGWRTTSSRRTPHAAPTLRQLLDGHPTPTPAELLATLT